MNFENNNEDVTSLNKNEQKAYLDIFSKCFNCKKPLPKSKQQNRNYVLGDIHDENSSIDEAFDEYLRDHTCSEECFVAFKATLNQLENTKKGDIINNNG